MKQLPNEAVEEYQELIRREFSHDISFEEARLSAESFMRVMRLVCEALASDRSRRLIVYCKCGGTDK